MGRLRQWFQSRRLALKGWMIAKAVSYGFQELRDAKLGTRLRDALDHKFGTTQGDLAQKELAKWLRQVADELLT